MSKDNPKKPTAQAIKTAPPQEPRLMAGDTKLAPPPEPRKVEQKKFKS